jgi:hypothetical protein
MNRNVVIVSVVAICIAVVVLVVTGAFSSECNSSNCADCGLCGVVSGCDSQGNCANDCNSQACESACTNSNETRCSSVASGGCSSRPGSCSSSGQLNIDFRRIEAEAMRYYIEKTGEEDITAKAYKNSSGIEVAIIKDEKVIDILTIGN